MVGRSNVDLYGSAGNKGDIPVQTARNWVEFDLNNAGSEEGLILMSLYSV